MRFSSRCLLAVAALMAASLLLGACGGEEEEKGAAPAAATETATPTESETPTQEAVPSPTAVSPSPTAEQVTPGVSRRQLKLDDAPHYLDVSGVLPGFRQLDPHEEGMSNQDLGLGADFSEVVAYLSEEPYQATFMFMYVASGEFEKASARAELRDVETLEEQFLAGFYEGVGDEEVGATIRWSDPAVGDTAKLARLTADFWGAETEIEAVIFLQEEGQEAALVFLLNLWYPFEPPKVDTLTIAREISARIANR